MESFVIKGGQPLSGTIRPSGNKNAALPVMAACLLADEPVVLHNVPKILDVETMLELVASTGAACAGPPSTRSCAPASGPRCCWRRRWWPGPATACCHRRAGT
jgi:UDP-N-acetylglucosamine enolpyruvyl transferase